MNPSCDIAIVGAGPAGAWTAYCLARRGARVRMFDSSHPREKPCGGGVTGRALGLVADAVGPRDIPSTVIRTARFIDSRAGDSAVVDLDGRSPSPTSLIVASRRAFDAALVAAAVRAGAVLDRGRVVNVAAGPHGVRVETAYRSYTADFLVGADGANSLVRRRIARPFPRRDLSIATGFFAAGQTGDEIVLELTSDPPGYIWSFPRPDHLAIGVCAQADAGATAEALRATTASWIKRSRVGADASRLEPYSWPIPSLDADGFRRLLLAGERWTLVGDAAGLVDPITREGIYFALLSAQWVAEALTSGHVQRNYTSRVHEEIAPELVHAARLKVGFFNPSFAPLLMRALQESEAIRRAMADLVAGRQSYRTLKWRLLSTLELRLAWRTIAHMNW